MRLLNIVRGCRIEMAMRQVYRHICDENDADKKNREYIKRLSKHIFNYQKFMSA